VGNKHNRRINSVYFIFVFLFLVISVKIIYLQAFRSKFFKNLAKNQHYRILRFEGGRGDILDRRRRILATSISCYSIFVDPSLVCNLQKIAQQLSSVLSIPEKDISKKIKGGKRFVWVKRKISFADKEKIKLLNLKGVGILKERKRFYPQAELAAATLGIVGIDNKGLEGLELQYNDYLRGKDGWVKVLQDSVPQDIALSSQIITPQEGADLILTIDAQIQYWAENYLKDSVEKFKAQRGSVVIMDAYSGGILALANYPGFDPNDSGSFSAENIRNNAVCDMFEPGSVFKEVALLAAISSNSFSDNELIFCENGKFKIPGMVLHDYKPYGDLTFKEVFIKSSNIGVAKVISRVGANNYYQFIKRLGFGELSGIDFPGEAKGLVKPYRLWSKTSEFIIPMGQEIAVNIIQLARSFSVVANGGYLVKPHIVKSICSYDFCEDIPLRRKKIFSQDVIEKAKNILIEAVEKGTGKKAGVEKRIIGGKTGTAQKFDSKIGKYSSSKYRANFVGFIEDIDPPLVIAVSVDEPRKSHFGGVVAAPVFKNISQKIIPYIEGESS